MWEACLAWTVQSQIGRVDFWADPCCRVEWCAAAEPAGRHGQGRLLWAWLVHSASVCEPHSALSLTANPLSLPSFVLVQLCYFQGTSRDSHSCPHQSCASVSGQVRHAGALVSSHAVTQSSAEDWLCRQRRADLTFGFGVIVIILVSLHRGFLSAFTESAATFRQFLGQYRARLLDAFPVLLSLQCQLHQACSKVRGHGQAWHLLLIIVSALLLQHSAGFDVDTMWHIERACTGVQITLLSVSLLSLSVTWFGQTCCLRSCGCGPMHRGSPWACALFGFACLGGPPLNHCRRIRVAGSHQQVTTAKGHQTSRRTFLWIRIAGWISAWCGFPTIPTCNAAPVPGLGLALLIGLWPGAGAVIVEPEWSDVIPEGLESIPPLVRARHGSFLDPAYSGDGSEPSGPKVQWGLKHLQCPYVESCRLFAETSLWLGVTLYSPGFSPKYLGLALSVPVSADAVIRELCKLQAAPYDGDACFVPVHPQRFGGSVAVVAYHPVIDLLQPVRKVVILDLSHVGGHYHCAFLPGRVIVSDLLESVQAHIAHDVEQVAVWAGDPPIRMHYNQVLELAHGMAIMFLLRDYCPGKTPTFRETISRPSSWEPLPHLPLCTRESAVLVHYEEEMFALRRRSDRGNSLFDVVTSVLGLPASEVTLLATREFGVVDFWGTPCTALLTAINPSNYGSARMPPSGKLVFVDGRVFGVRPRVLELCPESHFISDLLQQVNIDLPAGFDVEVRGCPSCGNSLFALLGSALRLCLDAPCRYTVSGLSLRHAQTPVGSEHVAAALRDDHAPTLGQAEAAAAGPFGPRPVFAPRFVPDEDDDPMGNDTEDEPIIRAKFVILTLEHTPEVLSLELPSPCDLSQLFEAVAIVRDPHRTQLFPQLVPIRQQPTQFWGTLIALPAWAEAEPIVLFNLLEIDGRYFLGHVPAVADKSTLCRLAGISHPTDITIYAFGLAEPLPDDRLIDMVCYGCLFFVPAPGRLRHGWNLSWMLLSPYSWDPDATIPVGPGGPADAYFCCVSDGGHHLFRLAMDRVPFFRQEVAGDRHLSVERTQVFPARPRVSDALVRGFHCRGVFGATDQLPDGSGQPAAWPPGTCIALADCRPLLQGWQLLYAPDGLLDLADLTVDLGTFAPAGYRVQIEGSISARGSLLVYSGQVLTVQFVPIVPDSSDASDSSSSGDSGDTDYESDGDHSVASASFAGPPIPRPARSRSRSPTPSSGPAGSRFGGHSHHPHLPGLMWFRRCVLLFMPSFATAVQLHPVGDSSATGPVAVSGGDMWKAGNLEHALSRGPQPDTSDASTSHDGDSSALLRVSERFSNSRPVPTPCRGCIRSCPDVSPGYSYGSRFAHGPTLLEVSAADPEFRGFYEARTLLEVLCEHHTSGPTQPLGPLQPESSREVQTLSLADTVPVSRFQHQCLELRAIVPQPGHTGVDSHGFLDDWLDNSLVELCEDRGVPAAIRRLLLPIQLWHRSGHSVSDILSLHIYTDGSAATGAQEVSPASWAFGVWCEVAGGLLYFGGAAGCAVPEGTPYHVGEVADTPVQAELLALVWALAWAVQSAPSLHTTVCFHYDATSVGRGVFGEHKAVACPSVSDGISLAAFCSHLRQYAEQLLWVHHAHVKSHEGCVPNELVDQLAKRIRRQGDSVWERCLPLWPSRLFSHPLVAWTWMLARSFHDLPELFAFESEASRLQAVPPLPEVFRRYDQTPVHFEGGLVEISITAISYNALTLKDKKSREEPSAPVGLRVVGRRAVLIAELQKHSPLFVGLQETRLQDTATLPDSTYIMFQAGATERGVGGCALWVACNIPYAHHEGRSLFLSQSHAVVSGFSHRHINVCFEAPMLRLFVVVAHCPSLANHPVTEVSAFWRDRLNDLQRRPSGMDYLILVDSNARVGDTVTEAIGPHQAEIETQAGVLFHDFVLAAEGFVPATFANFQEGPGDTWCSVTGALHRIDYIVTPASWRSFAIRTSTLQGFEALQMREDHIPVQLRAHFGRKLKPTSYCKPSRKAMRPVPAVDPKDRKSQIELISGLHTAPWWVDVDQQYDSFVTTMRQAANDLADTEARQPTQPYLTAGTLESVEHCRELRRYLRQETRERERRLQMIAFASFVLLSRGDGFSDRSRSAADRWLWELDHSEARGAALLRAFVTRVRNAVKADRRAYLQGLVSDVGQCQIRDPQTLYRALRKAFPIARSARRSSLTPLPAVIVQGETLAVTPAEKTECWRKHFGEQEAGEAVDASQYLAAYCEQRPRRTVDFDPRVVPSLFEIEQTIIGLKRAKAPGPDGVTSDMLRLVPVQSARKLLPIVIKASLAICEPIAWRGGSLHCLAKKAGAALQCKQFRSILLASTPGKVWHRATRNRLVPLLQKHGHATQAGTVAGISIEAISLLVRTYQASRHHSTSMWSLVFYDLQAAFYRVVRETLFQSDDSDGEIRRVVSKLGLPPEAMSELVSQLQKLAILPQFGASDHLSAIVEDMLRATWFTIGVGEVITLTHKGSRPGDPAADVIFSLVFAAFVRQVEHRLLEKGLLLPLPGQSQVHPWAQLSEGDTIGLPSWADDFVSPVEAAGPSQLIDVTRQTVTVVLTYASAIGMKLTFAEDKTAVLLPCGCDWSLYGATRDEAHGLGFSVMDPVTKEEHVVPIVEAYKHLGHILTSSTNPQPDIQLRRSRAQGTIKPLRTKLFGSKDVPISTRRLLLRSLAVSRFTHSSAALILPAAVHERLWDRAYLDLWRPLIPRKAADKQAHSFEVLRVAGAVSPPLMMAQARANFLKQLTANGPSVLRHVLFVHWRTHARSSWLAQIAEDVSLVLQYLPNLSPLFPSSKRLESLLDSLIEDPSWWLRKVKRAVQVFLQDLEAWHDKGMPSVVATNTDPPETDLPFACPLCDSRFALRKHVGAHLARTHKVWSPARHFALDVFCHSCHKWYGSVAQVANHLERSSDCLWRACHLFEPLSTEEIRRVESSEKRASKKISQGCWSLFRGVQQQSVYYGPRLPTAEERLQGADFYDEECTVADLKRAYMPEPSVVSWITQYISERSSEGPRQTTSTFWRTRAFHRFT